MFRTIIVDTLWGKRREEAKAIPAFATTVLETQDMLGERGDETAKEAKEQMAKLQSEMRELTTKE